MSPNQGKPEKQSGSSQGRYMTVAFIGSGNLGTTMIIGLLNTKKYNVIATDIKVERLEHLRKLGVSTGSDNQKAIQQAEVVFLCTTPLQMKSLLPEIAPFVRNKLIISVAAGITLSYLSEKLQNASGIFRALPTIGGSVNESTMGFAKNPTVSTENATKALQILNDLGRVFEVDELQIDYVTAISASGIAYILECFEGLAAGGVKVGLRRDLATQLVAHTALGAAKMVLDLGKEPSELKNLVTTAGGTTIAGLYEMEKQGVRYGLMSAVEAGAKRAREISGDLAR